MTMRILTYPNPFEIDKKPFWNEITRYPQFCASDTLVQGLERKYGRSSFAHLRTVEDLVKRLFGEWEANPQNDISLFLEVTTQIRGISDPKMRQAFLHNRSDVVEAVRFLVMLNADIDSFVPANLTPEQKALCSIYEAVKDHEACQVFEHLKDKNREDYKKALYEVIYDELDYALKNLNVEHSLELAAGPDTDEVSDRDRLIEVLKRLYCHFEEKTSGPVGFGEHNRINTYQDILERVSTLLKITKAVEDDSYTEKVIIHGVHRITPILYFLFRHLESLGIEVIFLIHYVNNLPSIYDTWREVYGWCGADFEYAESIDLQAGQAFGRAYARVCEGLPVKEPVEGELIKYSNLTEFANREVSRVFSAAGENLGLMKTQYYAVNGESSNDVLRVYYPSQFGDKHFLSYPIGQFILGLYNMWDFEKKTLIINEASLVECIVAGLFAKAAPVELQGLYRDIALYFSDVETLDEYRERIDHLLGCLDNIEQNGELRPLQRLSFFSVSKEQLELFKGFLDFLHEMADELFSNCEPEGTVDYGKHFANLMEIVANRATDEVVLSETERKLIDEILARLNDVSKPDTIKGEVEDLKEAIAFYLAGSRNKEHSQWIVRDFEQVDGAVLLSEKTRAVSYHFALLSNESMTLQPPDLLRWPLTERMFSGYNDMESSVPIVTAGLRERRNFLKYTLFYGTFFSKKDVKLSYVAEERGEEHRPYYILEILGLPVTLYKDQLEEQFKPGRQSDSFFPDSWLKEIEADAKEIFSICPYKFLLHEVLDAPIIYRSDYHVRYFVAEFMYYQYLQEYRQASDVKSAIEQRYQRIKEYFPMWGPTVLADLQRATLRSVNAGFEHAGEAYRRRKQNFLIAKWDEHGKRKMDFSRPNLHEHLRQYMKEDAELHPHLEDRPHQKVCENCNFSSICVLHYQEVHTHD